MSLWSYLWWIRFYSNVRNTQDKELIEESDEELIETESLKKNENTKESDEELIEESDEELIETKSLKKMKILKNQLKN